MTTRRLARLLLPLSAALFVLSVIGLIAGQEPFATWYYCFAWWPFILGAESWLHGRNLRSPLFEHPRRFFSLALLSIPVWLIFEAFNFRLHNWHYTGLPESLPLRWLGYSLSFATVLPGLDVTERLLQSAGLFSSVRTTPLADPRRLYLPLTVLGLVCLILPMAWPQLFFALIWAGFVFLPEPWLHGHGADSLLADLERGEPGRILHVLTAGAICGGLWEFWNFWATAKWQYTVPLVGDLKLFEMPVLGYIGFPPFALECMVMIGAIRLLHQTRLANRPGPTLLLFLLTVLFCLAAYLGIDAITWHAA